MADAFEQYEDEVQEAAASEAIAGFISGATQALEGTKAFMVMLMGDPAFTGLAPETHTAGLELILNLLKLNQETSASVKALQEMGAV